MRWPRSARKIDQLRSSAPTCDGALQQLYLHRKIRPRRPGSSKLTRLVKLCLGNLPAATVSRYAKALGVTRRNGWSNRRFESELRRTGIEGLTGIRPECTPMPFLADARSSLSNKLIGRIAMPRPNTAPPGWGVFVGVWHERELAIHGRVHLTPAARDRYIRQTAARLQAG
jgi:hypothetical protein